MGVYGTQTTLTTPTLDDRVVLSDAGVTKSSTLQQVLDVLVPAIDPGDLSVAADEVSYDDGSNVHVTGADVQAALDAVFPRHPCRRLFRAGPCPGATSSTAQTAPRLTPRSGPTT